MFVTPPSSCNTLTTGSGSTGVSGSIGAGGVTGTSGVSGSTIGSGVDEPPQATNVKATKLTIIFS